MKKKEDAMSIFARSATPSDQTARDRASTAPGAPISRASTPGTPLAPMPPAAVPAASALAAGTPPPHAATPSGAPSAAVAAVLFEEIVERYHSKVFQLVYRYTGDYDEACDLTQDTFVRAYGAWREFRGESQVYTWLYRIAINLCHNHQKKLQRRRHVESSSLDHRDSEADAASGGQWHSREVEDWRPLPLQILESRELCVRLHEALRDLPDNYRTVIILRDIEGLTYEEIARITECTLETIKSRLFRARNAIRRLMEPYILSRQGAEEER
jgi:RNA polymerase sigma-70 factor, ECF subfamily